MCAIQDFEGANVCFGDVQDTKSVEATAFASHVDVVVSCLASRTGGKVGFSHSSSKNVKLLKLRMQYKFLKNYVKRELERSASFACVAALNR